jgi:hypothetical protein
MPRSRNDRVDPMDRVNVSEEYFSEMCIREQDYRFQQALFEAYQRGEFPGQSFRLVP